MPEQGPSQPDLLIGQTIGNYLVTQKLGEGGMGSVYLAEHPSIGKKVALKVLHSEFSTNQEVAARFFHEAKAVNDIGHPNIVDIVDFGILQSGGGREQLVYFIMEYLAGQTLSHLIRAEAPLPPERALGIAMQVADALSASHKCQIVHRDLKPDNIILLQRGRERDFVKLLDFGIAKLTGGSAMGSHRTRTGIVMGTPAYMSPEQCEGRDSVDQRTDIYALGIVLYEMLTGRVPFLGDGYGEILVQHLTQRPVPPSQFRMLAPHIELVVLKALEKRADMRYPSMDEMMRAMADPVGYVESHGGVGGFLQRQLTPSTGPLPLTVRLTPSPLTPLPGTLIAPQVPTGAGLTGARTGAGVTGAGSPAAAIPTTLGSATGQVQPGRSKAGFIIAGLVVVAAAVAGIIAVAGHDKQPLVDNGSGSATAGPGSDKIAAADPGSAGSPGNTTAGSATTGSAASAGSAATGSATTGSADSAGSGSAAAVVPTVPTIPDRPGSGSAGSGDQVADANVTITVHSVPSGAHILVDGLDTEKVTPGELRIPRGQKIQVALRMKGYSLFTFSSVDTTMTALIATELVKTKSQTQVPVTPHPPANNNPPPKTNPPANNPPPKTNPPPQKPKADPDGLAN